MSALSAAVRRPRLDVAGIAWALTATVVAALIAIKLGTSASGSVHSYVADVAVVVIVPTVIWLFLSERYELTLALLLVYLGLFDGLVKLTTGSHLGTLGRDGLLYAITLGAITRMVLRRRFPQIPPFGGIVLAWIAVVVIQVANPSDGGLAHSFASMRQHLEFVPLFFFGYALLRSPKALKMLLALFVFVAAVNGIVNVIQDQLTPAQLAKWGPGYATIELGTLQSVARTFIVNGQAHVRPLGLGGDDGFGGLVCLIAFPALLALLSIRKAGRYIWLLAPAAVCVLVGIISSQTRVVVLGAVIAAVSFALLTVASRRGLIIIALAVVLGVVAFAVGSAFLSSNANRFSSIAPAHVISTAVHARSASLDLLPTYVGRYPLGAGIGSVGPAAGSGFGGIQATAGKLNGETQFNFLVVELGLPGLIVFAFFSLAVLRAGLRLRRVADPEVQRCLMAVTAVLIALTALWYDAPVSADSPTAPMIWLGAGCIAYWYQEMRAGRVGLIDRRLRSALAAR